MFLVASLLSLLGCASNSASVAAAAVSRAGFGGLRGRLGGVPVGGTVGLLLLLLVLVAGLG